MSRAMWQAVELGLATLLAGAGAPLGAEEAEARFGVTGQALFAPAGGLKTATAKASPTTLWGAEVTLLGGEASSEVPGGLLASSPRLGGFHFSPNFEANPFPLAAGALPTQPQARLSPGEKFTLAVEKTFYPAPLATAALGAGWSMLVDSSLDDGYEQGFDGFLRRWGARVTFNGTRHFVGTFALASILGQDPRYHPSLRRGVWRRAGYAISRVFVTRSDTGRRQFNISNIGGIAAAAGLANTWYRSQDAGGKETAARFGLGIAVDAAVRLFKEFVVHRNTPRD